jgi:hypothetical protein
MNEGVGEVPVTSDEQLARFILSSNWIRKSDQTVKPDAFIPHPIPISLLLGTNPLPSSSFGK